MWLILGLIVVAIITYACARTYGDAGLYLAIAASWFVIIGAAYCRASQHYDEQRGQR